MAHNPRRDKSPRSPADPFITDEMIADAMQRAHALRCHPGIDPATVELVPVDADIAIERMERRWRAKYGSWNRRLNSAPPDPWWFVGWVTIEIAGSPKFWGVWLNHDHGRAHLRYERKWLDADVPYR